MLDAYSEDAYQIACLSMQVLADDFSSETGAALLSSHPRYLYIFTLSGSISLEIKKYKFNGYGG